MKRLQHKNTKGFTIVEVITVIVVLGILTTIGYFTISDWRLRTARAEVASDLNGVASAMESARTFSAGYPATIPTTFKASPNVTVTLRSSSSTAYCAEAASKVITTVIYKVTNANKTPTQGVC